MVLPSCAKEPWSIQGNTVLLFGWGYAKGCCLPWVISPCRICPQGILSGYLWQVHGRLESVRWEMSQDLQTRRGGGGGGGGVTTLP